MVATQTLRRWYPELVTSGVDSEWRVIGPLRCDYTNLPTVTFFAAGQYPSGQVQLKVHPACEEAFRALATVFRNFGYPFRESAGGTAVCRKITAGSRTSPHAHGIALDINPSRNRYVGTALGGLIQWGKQTDMPKPMVEAALRIRTKSGKRVFGWGGSWRTIKDPMHWQVEVPQSDLAVGIDWSTVVGDTDIDIGDIEMTLKRGDQGNAVRLFQKALNTQGAGENLEPDGKFGEFTEQAVRRYQAAAQITVTGQIDGITAALLVRYTS